MASSRRPPRLLIVLALLLAPAVASARVKVEKSPPVVTRRTFDPRNPPKDMPPLGGDADAVTHFKFGCSTSASYAVTSKRRDRRTGDNTATARINDLTVKLDLEITIWLPKGARPKLVEHEEGHRVIAERIYATAEEPARREAQKWVGRSVTGRGKTAAEAADEAVREANHQFCQAYLDATSGWSGQVGDLYDDITDHGRRNPPPVDEAITTAFERGAADRKTAGSAARAATSPASSKR
jgi:hypothetical protein